MTAPTPLITGTDFITVATKDIDARGRLLRRRAGPARVEAVGPDARASSSRPAT